MGWLYNNRTTREDTVRQIKHSFASMSTNPESKFEVVEHSDSGSNLWTLYRSKEDHALMGINVTLIRADRREPGSWGRKDIGEEAFPYETDCPISFLTRSTLPDSSWRNYVLLKRRNEAKMRKIAQPGMTVTVSDTEYSLVRKIVGRHQWLVNAVATNQQFRMSSALANRRCSLTVVQEAKGLFSAANGLAQSPPEEIEQKWLQMHPAQRECWLGLKLGTLTEESLHRELREIQARAEANERRNREQFGRYMNGVSATAEVADEVTTANDAGPADEVPIGAAPMGVPDEGLDIAPDDGAGDSFPSPVRRPRAV